MVNTDSTSPSSVSSAQHNGLARQPALDIDESTDEPPIPRPPPHGRGSSGATTAADQNLGDMSPTSALDGPSGARSATVMSRTGTVGSLRSTSTRSSVSSFTLTDYQGAINGDPFHARDAAEVVAALETDAQHGLSEEEAAARLASFGENVFRADSGPSALRVLLRQMANAMTLILIAVMALSFGVRDYIEGGVIVAIIATNIIVGFVQEYRAEQTMASLRSLATPNATVVRGGEVKDIPSKAVVPGDVILVSSGAAVPADARLTWCNNLEVDEAILTGESLPVAKVTDVLEDPESRLGAGDRINTVFASTNCTKGRARAVVIATGMQTQMGMIAAALSTTQVYPTIFHRVWDKSLHWLGIRGGTPLQQKMARLSYLLLVIAVLMAIVVFAASVFQVTNEVVLYAVALGIGVIPESLIAVLTITFALGTKRMASRHVIVRKLDALEALGGVTDICSDKTGTITQGKMVLRELWTPVDGHLEVETLGSALELTGNISRAGESKKALGADDYTPTLTDMLHAASLCNIAVIEEVDGEVVARGDPTEIALQVFAHKAGVPRGTLVLHPEGGKDAYAPKTGRFESVAEYNFDSSVKRMTTVYHDTDAGAHERPTVLFMKGAVERILPCCAASIEGAVDEERIFGEMERLASKGLRVLAFAMRREHAHFGMTENAVAGGEGKKVTFDTRKFEMKREDVEREMVFLGLVGIYDPPRLESLPAVRACRGAGIRVRMVTGDHPATAAAIAREVEILLPKDEKRKGAVMVAADFDKMSDAEIDAMPDLPLVVARCTPETKVRMLDAGARRGYYMAMTGDGVNDAPALSRAAVGVAMGQGGSDVAKGAADLILTDDNFGSIVAAVEEGRRTYDNIQRFIVALIVGNVSEVILLMIGLAFVDASEHSVFPLSPLAILWVNLVTASPPALGLGFEPAAPDVMTRPPHDLNKGVFTWSVILDTFFYGAVSGVSCLLTFIIIVYGAGGGALGNGCNEELAHSTCPRAVTDARSAVFVLLTFHLLFICWEMKSLKRSIFNLTLENPWYVDLWRNQILFWSVIGGMAVLPICIYVPVFNTVVFRQTPMTWHWGLVVGMMVVYIGAIELWKLFMHRKGGYEWFGRKLKKGTKAVDVKVDTSEKETKGHEAV